MYVNNVSFLCYLCAFVPLSQKNELCLHIFAISLGGTLIFVSTKLITKTNKIEMFFFLFFFFGIQAEFYAINNTSVKTKHKKTLYRNAFFLTPQVFIYILA